MNRSINVILVASALVTKIIYRREEIILCDILLFKLLLVMLLYKYVKNTALNGKTYFTKLLSLY